MEFILFLLVIFLLIVLVPAVFLLAVPPRAVHVTLAWLILAMGILVLDYHTASVMPYDDDGVFPDPSPVVIGGWLCVMTVAIAIRHDALLWPPVMQESGKHDHFALSWVVPAGILSAVVGMHWLRNRLAGFEAAMAAHLVLLAGGVVVAGLTIAALRWAARAAPWDRAVPLLRYTLFVSASCIGLLVANIHMGYAMWSDAERFAAGRPWCAMTYGGFETRRVARNGWDLSPLVNRHYGVWAVRKTPFMVVKDGQALRSHRNFLGQWQDVNYEPPHCLPQK